MAHDSSSAALSAGRMQMPGRHFAMEPCSLGRSPSAAAASALGEDTWLCAQDGLRGGRPPCCRVGVCPLMSGPCNCFRLVDVCRAHVDVLDLWHLLDMGGMAQTQGQVTVIPDAVSSARDIKVLAGLGNILMACMSRAWSCHWLMLPACCSNTVIGASLNPSVARGSKFGTLIAV